MSRNSKYHACHNIISNECWEFILCFIRIIKISEITILNVENGFKNFSSYVYEIRKFRLLPIELQMLKYIIIIVSGDSYLAMAPGYFLCPLFVVEASRFSSFKIGVGQGCIQLGSKVPR